jgi:hypothetical protein
MGGENDSAKDDTAVMARELVNGETAVTTTSAVTRSNPTGAQKNEQVDTKRSETSAIKPVDKGENIVFVHPNNKSMDNDKTHTDLAVSQEEVLAILARCQIVCEKTIQNRVFYGNTVIISSCLRDVTVHPGGMLYWWPPKDVVSVAVNVNATVVERWVPIGCDIDEQRLHVDTAFYNGPFQVTLKHSTVNSLTAWGVGTCLRLQKCRVKGFDAKNGAEILLNSEETEVQCTAEMALLNIQPEGMITTFAMKDETYALRQSIVEKNTNKNEDKKTKAVVPLSAAGVPDAPRPPSAQSPAQTIVINGVKTSGAVHTVAFGQSVILNDIQAGGDVSTLLLGAGTTVEMVAAVERLRSIPLAARDQKATEQHPNGQTVTDVANVTTHGSIVTEARSANGAIVSASSSNIRAINSSTRAILL